MVVLYLLSLISMRTHCETDHPKPQMVHNTGWQGHLPPCIYSKVTVEYKFRLRNYL